MHTVALAGEGLGRGLRHRDGQPRGAAERGNYGIIKNSGSVYVMYTEGTSMNRRRIKWLPLLFGLGLAAGVEGLPAFAATNDLEYCLKGADALEAGETDLAVGHITRCIAEGNLTADRLAKAYITRGKAYGRKGDYDRAIQDFDDAIRLDPAYAKAYYNRGVAYGRKGDLGRALRDFDETIRLDPAYAKAYQSRGVAYGRKGDPDRAIRDFDEAIRLDPGNAVAYVARGRAFERKGDYDRAIRDHGEAIRLDPDYAKAYNNRCWVYGLSRRPQDALSDCNESLRLRPDHPAALDSRALAYWLLGEHEKAQEDLERARQLDSSIPDWQARFREFEELF